MASTRGTVRRSFDRIGFGIALSVGLFALALFLTSKLLQVYDTQSRWVFAPLFLLIVALFWAGTRASRLILEGLRGLRNRTADSP